MEHSPQQFDLDSWVRMIPGRADAAIILGSGLGGFADTLADSQSVSTASLPGYPRSTVPGHAGRIVVGKIGDTRVLAFQGRIHQYEGYSPEVVVLPVRIAHALGIRTMVVTNAAGSFTRRFRPGDLLLIQDHINLQFCNPLRGPRQAADVRFPDMSEPYDSALLQLAERVALEERIPLKRGTLGAVLGPTYETPAEAAMLARLGADAGCMSSVPEVLAARAMNMRVLGISCITNFAAGLAASPLSHEEVTAVAAEAADRFSRLLHGILQDLKPRN